MPYTVKDILKIEVAPALGCTEPVAIALGGNPALKLEVLDPINKKVVTKVQHFLKAGKVKVNLLSEHKGLYIKTRPGFGRRQITGTTRQTGDD